MEKQFEFLKGNRLIILKAIEDLSIEQLNKIPDNFTNNIVWHMGHLVVIQQLLCYKLSGLPMAVDNDMIAEYQKGTAPKREINVEEFEKIKNQFLTLPDTFKEDYTHKIFVKYQPYVSSLKITLNTIDDAIVLNNFHEGIHLGYILALKKLV